MQMPRSQESFLFCSSLYAHFHDSPRAQHVFTARMRAGGRGRRIKRMWEAQTWRWSIFLFYSTGDWDASCPIERSANLTFSWQNNILKYRVNRCIIKRKVCRIHNSDKHNLSTKQQAHTRCLCSTLWWHFRYLDCTTNDCNKTYPGY